MLPRPNVVLDDSCFIVVCQMLDLGFHAFLQIVPAEEFVRLCTAAPIGRKHKK
jgi:hypothetical protein